MPALLTDWINWFGDKRAQRCRQPRTENSALPPVLVNPDPTQGSEIAKTRLALVVSPDAMNKRIATVVICPLTSQLRPLWASRVQCECAGQPGEIAIDQIRAVSRQRLQKHIGKIDAETAAQVREAIVWLYATA